MNSTPLADRDYRSEETRKKVQRHCYNAAANQALTLPAGVDPFFDDPAPRVISPEEARAMIDGAATSLTNIYDTTDKYTVAELAPLILEPDDPGCAEPSYRLYATPAQKQQQADREYWRAYRDARRGIMPPRPRRRDFADRDEYRAALVTWHWDRLAEK